MQRDLVLDGLRFKLAEQYRENPTGFLSLSKEAVDSVLGREMIAELRNEGHVEEVVRGTIRLTPRGYRAFQNDRPPYSYRNCTSTVNLGRGSTFAVNRYDFST
jgi:hypothetical protein